MFWFMWSDYWTSRPYVRVTIRQTRFGSGWFTWDPRDVMSRWGQPVHEDRLQLIEQVSHRYWL